MPTKTNIEALNSRNAGRDSQTNSKSTHAEQPSELALRVHEQVVAMTETTLKAGMPDYQREYDLLLARMISFAKTEGRPMQRRIREVFHKAGGLLAHDRQENGNSK